MARVAIEAMREPTEGMVKRGSDLDDWSTGWCCPAFAKEHWIAMIDAALE